MEYADEHKNSKHVETDGQSVTNYVRTVLVKNSTMANQHRKRVLAVI